MKPFEVNVSSKYGAPMGRRSAPLADLAGQKVRLQRVRFVSGDYDQGGAYWGGAPEAGPLYCAWNENGAAYRRARSRDEAKQKFPGLYFYR